MDGFAAFITFVAAVFPVVITIVTVVGVFRDDTPAEDFQLLLFLAYFVFLVVAISVLVKIIETESVVIIPYVLFTVATGWILYAGIKYSAALKKLDYEETQDFEVTNNGLTDSGIDGP